MNILMIDTSGPACGVAVMKDGQIVCELQLTSGKTHSQRVMPMVEQALSMCEMTTGGGKSICSAAAPDPTVCSGADGTVSEESGYLGAGTAGIG